MAQADWSFLTGGLTQDQLKNGATAGPTKPNGGGSYVYGFRSLAIVDGVAALAANQDNFAGIPGGKGGSIRGVLKRAPSGGNTGFAPFLFIGVTGPTVGDSGYLLGLADGDPHHVVLRKGVLTDGLADLAPDPANGQHVLMRSIASYANDTWLHLRLDMIVEGTGDVILQAFQNDLGANPVSAPVWTTIPGMEGAQSPGLVGFVDDALGVNTGSAPFSGGRLGFGCRVQDVSRVAYFDQLECLRQL